MIVAVRGVTGGERDDVPGDERAEREFESAFGASLAGQAARQPAFDRSSPDLAARVARVVSAWQDQLMRLTQSDVTRWQGSGPVQDIAPVSVVTLVAMLGAPSQVGAFIPAPRETAQDAKDGIGPVVSNTVPREMLASMIGAAEAEALIARARADLRQRIGLLLDEEMLRYGVVLDEAGEVDAVAAVRLYQAEYSLEAAR